MSNSVIEILRGTLVDGYPKRYRVRKLVKNWPLVMNEDEDTMEELDVENFNVININKESVVICAGGDWQ
jgi:hypothetical protein